MPWHDAGFRERPALHFTVATRNALVVPASPNGTPAVTTISSPGAAKPSVNAARAARLTASPIE